VWITGPPAPARAAYVNWVVGNAILPDRIPIPTHEGIQKVDRTTVPELKELPTLIGGTFRRLDNAEGGLSRWACPRSLAFDINPEHRGRPREGTHFEQIYSPGQGRLEERRRGLR
jgi:hypothetical protein